MSWNDPCSNCGYPRRDCECTHRPIASVLEYNSFSIKVEFDEDDELFYGVINEIKPSERIYAKTIEDFKNAFHDAVDDDLEFHRQNR